MADFKNYDPSRIQIIFHGIIIRGYADGTFVKVERAKDSYSMAVGSTGDVVRVRSRDRTGSITLTLQAASPTNDLLSGFANADELAVTVNAGVGPIMVRDLNGTTLVSAENAWIRKMTNIEAAMEHVNREWVFDCASLLMVSGGALV